MIGVVINPGSGPVENATEESATENMRHFITDKKMNANFVRIPDYDYGDGRYAFLLWRGGKCHEIQMPGLPLHRVRFVNDPGQNIWNFPRLYVDDASWIWCFALNCVFRNDDEEE